MIIHNKKDGLIMVPITNKESGEEVKVGGKKMIRIIPGYNEIVDDVYNLIRPNLMPHIARGTIEEWGKRQPIKDEDGNTIDEKMIGTDLRRQQVNKAYEMVKNCYNLDTLELWLNGSDDYEQESRDNVRTLIMDQMRMIKRGGKTEDELESVGVPIRG